MSIRRCSLIGTDNTVALYLGRGGTYPALSGTTLQQFIDCQAIVHYTRSGTRTIVNSPSFAIQEGDFLIVPSSCSSGTAHTISNELPTSDFAYIMGTDTGRNKFYECAKNFMDRRPSTKKITTRTSLEEVLRSLTTGNEITEQIGSVLIVSHARGEGILFFRLNDSDDDQQITPSELYLFVRDGNRTQITSRIIRNDPEMIIRICGCNIGKHTGFLQQLKSLFGGNVTVVAPKHVQYYGDFPEENIVYECLLYDFMVVSKEQISSRSHLKQAFSSIGFQDIHGSVITDQQWAEWIPSAIHTPDSEPQTTVYPCTTPSIPTLSSDIKREYIYRHRRVFVYSLPYTNENPPSSTDARTTALRKEMLQHEKMQPDYPDVTFKNPEYLNYGYQSAEAMFDGLSWSFHWDSTNRVLECTGFRNEYIVRIPITESDSSLIFNALENEGDPGFRCNGLSETDSRLFGRV